MTPRMEAVMARIAEALARNEPVSHDDVRALVFENSALRTQVVHFMRRARVSPYPRLTYPRQGTPARPKLGPLGGLR
jgi:hypothetical protein